MEETSGHRRELYVRYGFCVKKALYDMVNMKNTELSSDLLDEMVSSISVENRHYVWHYRYAPQKKRPQPLNLMEEKKTPVIRIDGTPANVDKRSVRVYPVTRQKVILVSRCTGCY